MKHQRQRDHGEVTDQHGEIADSIIGELFYSPFIQASGNVARINECSGYSPCVGLDHLVERNLGVSPKCRKLAIALSVRVRETRAFV